MSNGLDPDQDLILVQTICKGYQLMIFNVYLNVYGHGKMVIGMAMAALIF